ncbi:hypothetical protein BV25DRAFT_203583 [Artomyces pyxidatus]|uniref:Uncharacterized protein n=1 Tax=Artomyces pyxidatus TaxID=48021 RepID=A0ACB8T9B7_9AGAM|nr:hypothetical protein BV25DRAFT_203583 [Artomyces pyxidatus]
MRAHSRKAFESFESRASACAASCGRARAAAMIVLTCGVRSTTTLVKELCSMFGQDDPDMGSVRARKTGHREGAVIARKQVVTPQKRLMAPPQAVPLPQRKTAHKSFAVKSVRRSFDNASSTDTRGPRGANSKDGQPAQVDNTAHDGIVRARKTWHETIVRTPLRSAHMRPAAARGARPTREDRRDESRVPLIFENGRLMFGKGARKLDRQVASKRARARQGARPPTPRAAYISIADCTQSRQRVLLLPLPSRPSRTTRTSTSTGLYPRSCGRRCRP